MMEIQLIYMKIHNIGNSIEKYIHFTLDPIYMCNTYEIEALDGINDPKKKSTQLEIIETNIDCTNVENNKSKADKEYCSNFNNNLYLKNNDCPNISPIYKITLKRSIDKDDSISLYIKILSVGNIGSIKVNGPKEIPKYYITGDLAIWLPYTVEKQTIQVTLKSNKIVDTLPHTVKSINLLNKLSNSTSSLLSPQPPRAILTNSTTLDIVFWDEKNNKYTEQLMNIKKFTRYNKLYVEYRDDIHYVQANNMYRDIRVSQQQNTIHIKDTYILQNYAAKINGTVQTNSFDDRGYKGYVYTIGTNIPLESYDISCSDLLGKLYDTRIQKTNNATLVQLSLRNPLLGGWTSTITLQYSLPSNVMISSIDSTNFLYNKQILDIPLQTNFNFIVKNLDLHIHLPNIAYSIKWYSKNRNIKQVALHTTKKLFFNPFQESIQVQQKNNLLNNVKDIVQVSFTSSKYPLLYNFISFIIMQCYIIIPFLIFRYFYLSSSNTIVS